VAIEVVVAEVLLMHLLQQLLFLDFHEPLVLPDVLVTVLLSVRIDVLEAEGNFFDCSENEVDVDGVDQVEEDLSF
jgi:hypothetical protein